MPRNILGGEDAKLIKVDGSSLDVNAQFGKKGIITHHVDPPIEVGDVFVRQLPNGVEERYRVVDPTYTARFGSIAASYSCDVEKQAGPRATATGATEEATLMLDRIEPPPAPTFVKKVFLVHGHDEAAIEAMGNFLRGIGLEVVTWGHAKRMSRPGLKSNADVVRSAIDGGDAIVVLFTPDELARRAPHLEGDPDERYQPRPNVLLEAGWAFGAHGQKTVIVEVGMVNKVSDLAGIQCVRIQDQSSLNDLANELEHIGCKIDRQDPRHSDPKRFPGLFRPPPTPELVGTSRPEQDAEEELDDESLFEIQKDKLPPRAAFYPFTKLDAISGLPAGTAKRFAVRAAKIKGRYEDETENGVRLNTYNAVRGL